MYYVCNILKWDQNRKWKVTGGYELNTWKIKTEIWYFKQVGFKKKDSVKILFQCFTKIKYYILITKDLTVFFVRCKRFDNFSYA